MAKRIQFDTYGKSKVMKYVNFTPINPRNNEVQIENKVIGVNYIDIYVRSGLYPQSSLPSGLGTEAAGIVIKLGPGIKFFNIGDRVVYAQSSLGAYSTIHNVNENKIVKLPNNISFEQAAASFLKGLTVFYLLRQLYKIKKNEIFLFHAAAGGVGSIACQWSKAIGAKMVGTVSNLKKELWAKKSGAWKIINYCKENVSKRIMEMTNGKKVNVVYDSVGKNTWETSLDCLRKCGLMVSFGNSSGPVTGINLGILNQKGSLFVTRPSINDYIHNNLRLRRAADELFDMITNKMIKADVLTEQMFSLAEAQLAHQALEHRQTNGSILLFP